jgi:hypothetical protein
MICIFLMLSVLVGRSCCPHTPKPKLVNDKQPMFVKARRQDTWSPGNTLGFQIGPLTTQEKTTRSSHGIKRWVSGNPLFYLFKPVPPSPFKATSHLDQVFLLLDWTISLLVSCNSLSFSFSFQNTM